MINKLNASVGKKYDSRKHWRNLSRLELNQIFNKRWGKSYKLTV